jgi:hypothetical protein
MNRLTIKIIVGLGILFILYWVIFGPENLKFLLTFP